MPAMPPPMIATGPFVGAARSGRGSAADRPVAPSAISTARRVWPGVPGTGGFSPAAARFKRRAWPSASQNVELPRITPPLFRDF